VGFVLHSAMDPTRPWMNTTFQSTNKADLLTRCGSRYAPSSPCDGLKSIEESRKPCVFIGKPCDAAAVMNLRRLRPKLDANLALVMTFFCAGTPSTLGTLELLQSLNVHLLEVEEIAYRGEGWPGNFRVTSRSGTKQLSYEDSWGYLQKFRCFRCHLCPDGLGEVADVSCGDAWHRYKGDGDSGTSLILARTARGMEIVNRAREAGYLELTPSGHASVLAAQGLAKRRSELFGRLLAMRLMSIPAPHFIGFPLFKAWLEIPLDDKVRTVLGTWRRVMSRRLFRPRALTEASILSPKLAE
jgi:coenzyme F420 hydrogenase subunit beta